MLTLPVIFCAPLGTLDKLRKRSKMHGIRGTLLLVPGVLYKTTYIDLGICCALSKGGYCCTLQQHMRRTGAVAVDVGPAVEVVDNVRVE